MTSKPRDGHRQPSIEDEITSKLQHNTELHAAVWKRADDINETRLVRRDATCDSMTDFEVMCVAYQFLKNTSDDRLRSVTGHLAHEQQQHHNVWKLLESVRVELVRKTTELRNASPERVKLAIERAAISARDEVRASCATEIAALHARVAEQDMTIAELRAAKKKLREALDRAK